MIGMHYLRHPVGDSFARRCSFFMAERHVCQCGELHSSCTGHRLDDQSVQLHGRFRRTCRRNGGERIWEAHRNHYYQRLILAGWSHRKTAVSEYAFMLMCSGAAMLCLLASPAVQLLVTGSLAAAFVAAMRAIDLRWRKFSASAHD